MVSTAILTRPRGLTRRPEQPDRMCGVLDRIVPHRVYSFADVCSELSLRPRQLLALKGTMIGYLDWGERLCCFTGQSLVNFLLRAHEDPLRALIARIDPGRLYRVGEVSEIFGVPVHHVGRLRREFDLPAVTINSRTYRYAGSDLQEFMRERFREEGDFDE